jgi:hypothetical protein
MTRKFDWGRDLVGLGGPEEQLIQLTSRSVVQRLINPAQYTRNPSFVCSGLPRDRG